MSLEQDAAALLGQVEAYKQGECAKLRKGALHEAEALTRQAHGEARRRVHEVLAALRRDANARIAASEARTQAWRRSREHRATEALLEAGWSALRDELVRRWRDPTARTAWVDTLAQQALATLPHARWQVRHPPDWPEDERHALAARLPEEPEWQPNPAISAGVCFCAGGACLDGTRDGLLADRAAVQAALLAALEEQAS